MNISRLRTLLVVSGGRGGGEKGKAVLEDLIRNEFLKTSARTMLTAVLNLFNQCLNFGVYHICYAITQKKSIYDIDPNSYRAIVVASNLGKTFINILIKRLMSSRPGFGTSRTLNTNSDFLGNRRITITYLP